MEEGWLSEVQQGSGGVGPRKELQVEWWRAWHLQCMAVWEAQVSGHPLLPGL